jgi:molecular chaperone DnaK (HSP70)
MTASETQIFLNKVELVKEWPTIEGGSLDKTRTALAYNRATGEVVAWGSKVKESHDTQVTHFKLGLEMHAKQHYDEYLGDSNWQHPSLPQKTPVQFTADFLDMLHKYLKDDFLSKTRYGKRFYSNLHFSYALTVPAIWSDKAKELTRQAALQAGIPDDRLTLITEPEAAAVYCAATCTEVDLNEGDRFLVCDAGGGTVVAPLSDYN